MVETENSNGVFEALSAMAKSLRRFFIKRIDLSEIYLSTWKVKRTFERNFCICVKLQKQMT